MARIRPLKDKVVVQDLPPEEFAGKEQTIVMPDVARAKNQALAIVLAVGEGLIREDGSRVPPEVKEGEVVIVPGYGGMRLELEGDEFRIICEADIMGVVEDYDVPAPSSDEEE